MNRILLLILLVPSAILFCCQQAPAQRKLLILGSSTSNCSFGITSPDSCYVYRIQKYYKDHGFPIQVANRSRAGDDVYYGMPTGYVPPVNRHRPDLDTNITSGLREENPDVVLVNYPSNGYDSFTVGEVMFCLRTIKQTANAAGKPCFITTTQPRSTPELFLTSKVKRVMAQIKDSVLAEFGFYAINFWDDLVSQVDTTILLQYNDGDLTHPNNAGHALLAKRVINANMFNIALPLHLVNFSSKQSGNGITIEWTVEAEKDIRSYQLEKSSDGRTFSKVYKVAALNTSKSHSYSFNDQSNTGSVAYYRLGSAGKDNFINYSQTIEVKGAGREATEKIYLSNNSTLVAKLNSDKNKQVKLGIFSATGQRVMEKTRSLSGGTNNLSIDITDLKAGLYFLKVYGQGVDAKARPFSKP